jgi:ribulose-phosphate 3-epimerase
MAKRTPMIVPSVLPADFSELGQQVKQLEKAGVDRIQWDVMDGRFVPNLTFGPDVIAASRGHATIGFEAHLMVEDPDPMLHPTLGALADLGAREGVALNPATPLEAVTNVLDLVDLLLVMTVNPGFGGQKYLSSMEPKIADARAEIDRRGLDVELEVDGSIGAAASVGAEQR